MRKSTLIVGAGIAAALVIGTGGGAYAAATITGANIKNESVTGSDIKNSSLTTSDIKNGTLTGSDLNPTTLASLARTSGKTGVVVHDGSVDGMGAKCPSGTVFVSGGGYLPIGSSIWYSGPDWDATGTIIPNSWLVIGDNDVEVSYVTCYSPSGKAIPGAVTSVSQLEGLGVMTAGVTTMSAKAQDKLAQAKK